MDNLIRKSQVDIIQAVNEDFYDDYETVEAKQGFRFALTLGKYREGLLDPRIGRFLFHSVTVSADTSSKPDIKLLNHHVCTDEEIGHIRNDQTKFMPIKET